MPSIPKAYLRVDPNIDQHPDPLGMILLLCAAARQPQRGRFKSAAVLARLIGKRRLRALSDRGDLTVLFDGTLYVDGWDEWQEGDYTVRERMERLRSKQRDITVTSPSPHRTNVSSRASSTPTLTLNDEERGPGGETPPWLRAWLQVRMRMPTAKQQAFIDSYLLAFDATGPERAARIFLGSADDPLGALIADLKAFREEAKGEAVKAEQEAIARRKVERRGFRPGTVEYELAQQLYAKQNS